MCKDCAICKYSLDIDSDVVFEYELDGNVHDCEDTCENFEE